MTMTDKPYDKVVADPTRFKERLGIGEDAYRWLSTADHLKDLIVGGGGGVSGGLLISQIPAIATALGGTWVTTITGGLIAAATPPLWVAGIVLVTAGGGYGALRGWKKISEKTTITIPKHINTPLDFLANAMFENIAPLCLKICYLNDHLSDDERENLKKYFVKNWGYDKKYFKHKIEELMNDGVHKKSTKSLVKPFVRLIKENPDCNHKTLIADLLKALNEFARLDGGKTEADEAFLGEVEGLLK